MAETKKRKWITDKGIVSPLPWSGLTVILPDLVGTKEVIRICKSNDREHNDQKEKDKHRTQDGEIRTTKNRG